MEGLGTYLKQGRREAGLSLEDLAGRTRIRIENLERLEREALDDLPNELYVRGFVKLVCQELGLSPQEGLARYESLKVTQTDPRDEIVWTGAREAEDTSTLERVLRDPERVIGTAKWVAGGVGALLVLMLLVSGGRTAVSWWQARGDVGEPAAAAVTPGEVAAGQPAANEVAPSDPAPTEAPAEATPKAPAPEPAREPMDLALADVSISLPPAGIRPDPSLAEKLATAPASGDPGGGETGAGETGAGETGAGDPGGAVPEAPAEASRPTFALTETSPDLFRGDPAVRPDESLAELLRPAPTPATPPASTPDPDLDAVATAESAAGAAGALESKSATEGEEVAAGGADAEGEAAEGAEPTQVAEADRAAEAAAGEARPVESPAVAPDREGAAPAAPLTSPEPIVVRSSASGRARLEIEAVRPVEVTVLLDGVGFPRTRSLAAGERKRYFAEERFVLSASDAGAVRVWLDGREISGLGDAGARLSAREIRRR